MHSIRTVRTLNVHNICVRLFILTIRVKLLFSHVIHIRLEYTCGSLAALSKAY